MASTKPVNLRIGDLLPRIRAAVDASDDYRTVSAFVRAAVLRLLREIESR